MINCDLKELICYLSYTDNHKLYLTNLKKKKKKILRITSVNTKYLEVLNLPSQNFLKAINSTAQEATYRLEIVFRSSTWIKVLNLVQK